MKKVLSLMLAVLLMFTVTVPAFTASAAENCLTVYVEGYGHRLYKNNINSEENRIYELNADVGGIVKEVIKPCLEKLAYGMVSDNFDAYCDELYNAMAPLYDQVRLDKNGEASDGSGWGGDMLTHRYGINYNGLTGGRITFQYDWRLSPEYNAQILEQFIDRVCRERKVEKVNLLGRCLGGNIVNAYLQNGKNLDKINKVILYIPSTMGLSTIGALFSGNIVIDSDAVSYFADYIINNKDFITDPMIRELITAVVEMLNYASVLGVGLDTLSYVIDKVKDNIIPRLVRDTYGSFPSFWAMCPAEDIDAAVELCYGTEELKQEYAGTIEKIYSYKEIQLNAYENMKQLKQNGMDIMVISKYNLPDLPLSKDGRLQSDSLAETYRTSFDATTSEYGSVLSQSYIKKMSEEDKKFLSPDHKIDASTCLFPETTWFIKNCGHGNFPLVVDYLMNNFLVNNNYTVFSDENYPQYLDYSVNKADGSESLLPVTELDSDASTPSKNQERFGVFFRFFTAILKFLSKLFGGELNIPFGKAA